MTFGNIILANPMNLLFLILFLILSTFVTDAFGQSPIKSNADTYQNRQRALRLVLLKNEIKGLDDAPMRCFARLKVAEFIFHNDVRGEFDSATSMAIDCLEDTVNNSDQFTVANAERWKNSAISILRQKTPDVAAKAENKYLADVDSALSDLQELNRSGNTVDIANRTILKIAGGKVSDYVVTIYQNIRQKDPKSANKILSALLGYFERTPDTASYSIMLDFMRDYYLDENAPVELTTRYLEFVVNRSRRQIGDPDASQTAQSVLWTLKYALPRIKETIPSLYTEAESLMLVLDSRLHKNDRESEEAYQRIDESKDKLQQAISEAEAAEGKAFESNMWLYASNLALEKKKFQMAVDCRLKVAPGIKQFVRDHDYFLLNSVLPAALKDKDFEASEYVIKRIDDDIRRSGGMLKIAARWLDLGDKAQAFEYLEGALKLLQKAEATTDVVRIMLSALPIAIGIEKSKGFETVSLAIKIANGLPTPTVDDRVGTVPRIKYVDGILLPNAFDLETAFKTLAKSDVGFSASTAQEIQLKSWKLVAEIVVETERKYPLPKEQNKIDQSHSPKL